MSTQTVKEVLDRVTPNAPNVTQHPMVVADDNPLTVYLDGNTAVAVQAISLTGALLPAGSAGIAYWAPPLPPVVFITANDTGWIDVTYNSGFTSANGGQLAYRKINNQVFLKGGADRTAGNFTTTAEAVANLPTVARPSATERFASYGTGGRLGRIEITTSGDVNVAAPNLISSTDEVFGWMGLSHTFLAD